MGAVLGPRWTQLIPKAGEPAEPADDDAEETAAENDSDRLEPPSGARPATGESRPLGGRGKPEPTPRLTRRHAATPAPAPRQEPAPDAPPVWKPEPPEPTRSAEPLSSARSREVDPDSAYAKPKPMPRRARPGRLGRGRARPRRAAKPGVPGGEEGLATARSAGFASGALRERDVFEIVSMVCGAIIVFFGLWGAIATIGGGIGSAGFVISVIFFLLGAGRLYMGFRGHRPVTGG